MTSKTYPKTIETEIVKDLTKYKTRRGQARYYWAMKKCNAKDLARHCGVTHSQAGRWILAFIKERGGTK